MPSQRRVYVPQEVAVSKCDRPLLARSGHVAAALPASHSHDVIIIGGRDTPLKHCRMHMTLYHRGGLAPNLALTASCLLRFNMSSIYLACWSCLCYPCSDLKIQVLLLHRAC